MANEQTNIQQNVPVQENSKMSFMQRLAYTIIDFGVIFMLYFGFLSMCMNTKISSNYHKSYEEIVEIRNETGEETGYYIRHYLEDGEKTNYEIYVDKETGKKYYYTLDAEKKDAYTAKIKANDRFDQLTFTYKLNYFVIVITSAACAETICLLIIPLVNKRRATLGVLFASGIVISKKYVDKARWYNILFRYLFILIINTIFLYFVLGDIILFLMPFITMLSQLTNKDRRAIHDLCSGVMIVDKRTYVPLVDHESEKLEDK